MQKYQTLNAIAELLTNQFILMIWVMVLHHSAVMLIFFDCCEVTILPLIPNLPLKKNKCNWGYIFRFEFLEIQHPNFEIISSLMLPEQKQIEVASVELTTHK
jgi:hypothetical protein